MDLLEQCRIWHEEEAYQKIIDALEAVPRGERTPELDSELARAYNNIAGQGETEPYRKALELLMPHEAYFQGDHVWNFRVAYALFYLDREGPALRHFERALEALPGDKDTLDFIKECRRLLSIPRFEKNFRERTLEAWAAFEEGEAGLRAMMDRRDPEEAETLMEQCKELLSPAFEEIGFELGQNGEKYELVLTPEGGRARLFPLVCFQRHAPAGLLERWNIRIGRQASRGFALRWEDTELTAGDVLAWVERKGEKKVGLTLFCEALTPLLQKDENRAWWFLTLLTDQTLGEIPAMALIDSFDVAEAPLPGTPVTLEALPGVLQEMGFDLNISAEDFLENSYAGYRMEPDQDPEADWRRDVIVGSTRCPELINEYLSGNAETMDAFHQIGAVPGFFCYPLDGFEGEERGAAILDFRDALEAAVLEEAGEDAVTFLGGATGLYCGYLDFIAWDIQPVLAAAKAWLEDSPVGWANFHVFRSNVLTVPLVDKSDSRG